MLPANTSRMNGNVPVPLGISWVVLFQVLYPPVPSEIWFNEMAFQLKFINHWTFRRWVLGKKPLILTIHQPGHISMKKGVIPLVHPRKINIALETMIVAWKSTFLLGWPIIKGYVSLLKLFREGTLSPIIMEVENHPKWKETHFWRDPFSTGRVPHQPTAFASLSDWDVCSLLVNNFNSTSREMLRTVASRWLNGYHLRYLSWDPPTRIVRNFNKRY